MARWSGWGGWAGAKLALLGLVGVLTLQVVAQDTGSLGAGLLGKGGPFGFEVEGPREKQPMRRLPNGHLQASEKVRINVVGLGARELSAEIDDAPMSEGGLQVSVITDLEARQTTRFAYEPARNAILIGEGEGQLVAVRNPDGTYLVGGRAAPNGKAALALMKESATYTGVSRHSLLLAYTHAQKPPLESRQPTNCGGRTIDVASSPAVCTVFKDLCDCIACDAGGRRGACTACP